MVGFYTRADSTKPVRLDLDNELVGKLLRYFAVDIRVTFYRRCMVQSRRSV